MYILNLGKKRAIDNDCKEGSLHALPCKNLLVVLYVSYLGKVMGNVCLTMGAPVLEHVYYDYI